MTLASKTNDFVVVGAGVIGLNISLVLKNDFQIAVFVLLRRKQR